MAEAGRRRKLRRNVIRVVQIILGVLAIILYMALQQKQKEYRPPSGWYRGYRAKPDYPNQPNPLYDRLDLDFNK